MVNSFRGMHLGVICLLFVVSSVTAQTTELPACPSAAEDCEGDCATTCADEECGLISAETCETTGLIDICNRDLIGAEGATATMYGTDGGTCCVRRRGTRGRRLCNPNLAVALISLAASARIWRAARFG